MIKRYSLMTALIVILTIPAMVVAIEKPFLKPLCEFPYFGEWHSFYVRFDQRFYDEAYILPNQFPNGGSKFALYLGDYATETERDYAVDKIKKVIFTNKGQSYEIRKRSFLNNEGQSFSTTVADKFVVKDQNGEILVYNAEYYFWIGHVTHVVGLWDCQIITKKGIFYETFEITPDMLEYPGPKPVNGIEVLFDADNDQWVISAETETKPMNFCGPDEDCVNYRLQAEEANPFNENGETYIYAHDDATIIFGQPQEYNNGRAIWKIRPGFYDELQFRIISLRYDSPLPSYDFDECQMETNGNRSRAIVNFLLTPEVKRP